MWGATGAVGQEMIRMLEQSSLDPTSLLLLASRRSEGKELAFRGEKIVVQELKEDSFDQVDIALFSAGGSISQKFVPIAAEKGCICIDNTSFFRMDPSVPLIVPEVNGEQLFSHNNIIANPNCSTIQLVLVLAPLHRRWGIKRVIVSTYQSVSGAGQKVINELCQQTKSLVDSKNPLDYTSFSSDVLDYPIAFNIIPQIDVFSDGFYTKEELKVVNESRKILDFKDLAITCTAARVPVIRTHCESVNIEFESSCSREDIMEELSCAKGVVLQDDPVQGEYPMPYQAIGQTDTFVGRIRQDFSCPSAFNLWITSDNLLKGASYNAVQIAEKLCSH